MLEACGARMRDRVPRSVEMSEVALSLCVASVTASERLPELQAEAGEVLDGWLPDELCTAQPSLAVVSYLLAQACAAGGGPVLSVAKCGVCCTGLRDAVRSIDRTVQAHEARCDPSFVDGIVTMDEPTEWGWSTPWRMNVRDGRLLSLIDESVRRAVDLRDVLASESVTQKSAATRAVMLIDVLNEARNRL